jgi:hypothetical protein
MEANGEGSSKLLGEGSKNRIGRRFIELRRVGDSSL